MSGTRCFQTHHRERGIESSRFQLQTRYVAGIWILFSLWLAFKPSFLMPHGDQWLPPHPNKYFTLLVCLRNNKQLWNFHPDSHPLPRFWPLSARGRDARSPRPRTPPPPQRCGKGVKNDLLSVRRSRTCRFFGVAVENSSFDECPVRSWCFRWIWRYGQMSILFDVGSQLVQTFKCLSWSFGLVHILADLIADIRQGCSEYGAVEKMEVPRIGAGKGLVGCQVLLCQYKDRPQTWSQWTMFQSQQIESA